jgi:hypothetical protein
MYQHLLFNHDDYYFNREWAMKYMDYYGMEKDKIDKIFEVKNIVKNYINDEKLMLKDCKLIVERFTPHLSIDCICYFVKHYQRYYILIAETNPAMAKYLTPAVWWETAKTGLDVRFDVDLEY